MGEGSRIRRGPIREVKPEIRILGVTGCLFQDEVKIIGAVCRGKRSLDGVLMASLSGNALEATDAVVTMVRESPHFEQIRALILDGVLMADALPVDIKRLREVLGLPVIAFLDRDIEVEELLQQDARFTEKLSIARRVGRSFRCQLEGKVARVYLGGVTAKKAREILAKTARNGLPEAIRVVRILARAVKNLKNR